MKGVDFVDIKAVIERLKKIAAGKEERYDESEELMQQIYEIGRDMEQSRLNYEFASDETLIDMYIYTLKAQEMKYKHLLERAKKNAS